MKGSVELGLLGKERIQRGNLREMKEAVDKVLRLRYGREGRRILNIDGVLGLTGKDKL